MGLDFTLTYLPNAASEVSGITYVMVGGPLIRRFTSAEWHTFVKDQPSQEQGFYKEWANKARDFPATAIKRSLT